MSTDKQILANYKAVMRKRVKSAGYPARWRQYAREVTAARYGVSHAEIKRIVAENKNA